MDTHGTSRSPKLRNHFGSSLANTHETCYLPLICQTSLGCVHMWVCVCLCVPMNFGCSAICFAFRAPDVGIQMPQTNLVLYWIEWSLCAVDPTRAKECLRHEERKQDIYKVESILELNNELVIVSARLSGSWKTGCVCTSTGIAQCSRLLDQSVTGHHVFGLKVPQALLVFFASCSVSRFQRCFTWEFAITDSMAQPAQVRIPEGSGQHYVELLELYRESSMLFEGQELVSFLQSADSTQNFHESRHGIQQIQQGKDAPG